MSAEINWRVGVVIIGTAHSEHFILSFKKWFLPTIEEWIHSVTVEEDFVRVVKSGRDADVVGDPRMISGGDVTCSMNKTC